ncbi:uncharacterized protein LOC141606213 [Silene latifolia]|uniref:uncharacterized protein LOC141606213 n=1 Tax=Silene latifolia TaxID=37657 RepID=UPI003D776647
MGFGENVAKMEKGTVDRISELPEFILHSILSNLDTKEVGRTSVLSKRWYEVWSSVPVLVFQLKEYKKEYWDSSKENGFNVDDDVIQSFLGFIDRTMQRYDTRKYRIRKFDIQLPTGDKKIEPLVDEWIRIAVQNQVEELHISLHYPYTSEYRLPEILFHAKSLKVLNCINVVLPYYGTMELVSLEDLVLVVDTVDTDLLQRIISFCPLVEFNTSADLGKISFPCPTIMNECGEFKFKVSPLRQFVFFGTNRVVTWPLNMNMVALKNLRKLFIESATVTDDILTELANGLKALESLVLTACPMLKCITISSISLKELRIEESLVLIKVTIDAPNLMEFWYHCEVETSLSLIKVPEDCDAQFFPLVIMNFMMTESLNTNWLIRLKKILEENLFKSLVVELFYSLQMKVDEEQLRNVVIGPPYKLRELKLRETHALDYTESSLTALDGYFLICHPDLLSITTSLRSSAAEPILNFLKRKVQCWRHPLKGIEVEGIDGSSLLWGPSEVDFRIRLLWQ